MPRFPAEPTLQFTMTLTELGALNQLLIRVLCPAGKLDLAAILQAADGDRELYSEMLCALIHVQTAGRRALDPNWGNGASQLLVSGTRPIRPARA